MNSAGPRFLRISLLPQLLPQFLAQLLAQLLALSCLCLASCGWNAGGLAPENAATVGVEVFWTNEKVLERDLEPALQRELSRAVIDLSGLSLARASQADLVVRGKIQEYRRRGGIRSQDNQLLESAVRLLVEAELYDRRLDRVIRTAPGRIWSGYALVEPGEESQAKERALRHLAETLTLTLFQPGLAQDPGPESEPR
ncbi:MAG: hypothetical protein ACI82F_001068 [Planctomycetota bacterium]